MAGAVAESSAPMRDVKRMQFGILSPDEIVSHSPVAVRRHRPSDRLGETLPLSSLCSQRPKCVDSLIRDPRD